MRKLLIVLIVAILSVGTAFFAASCNQKVDVPGSVWTNKEVCSYAIFDGDDKTPVGALVITTERLDAGKQVLNATGEEYTISSASTRGTRVTMVASDVNGQIWLKSESILNGFTSLASYRKVTKGDTDYTVKARYDGKNYRYSVNGGAEKKMKIKSGFLDNELLYTVVRCYAIESAYSANFTVVDPMSGSKESITVATAGEGNYQEPIAIKENGVAGETKRSTSFTRMVFKRAEAPVGAPIYVDYSKADGLKVLGAGATGYKSTRIPVQIKENNLTYKLVSVECE